MSTSGNVLILVWCVGPPFVRQRSQNLERTVATLEESLTKERTNVEIANHSIKQSFVGLYARCVKVEVPELEQKRGLEKCCTTASPNLHSQKNKNSWTPSRICSKPLQNCKSCISRCVEFIQEMESRCCFCGLMNRDLQAIASVREEGLQEVAECKNRYRDVKEVLRQRGLVYVAHSLSLSLSECSWK